MLCYTPASSGLSSAAPIPGLRKLSSCLRRIMPTQSLRHHNRSVCTLLLVLSMSALPSLAQIPAPQARITQALDEKNLVVLSGNVHPLARANFDAGLAPLNLPLN